MTIPITWRNRSYCPPRAIRQPALPYKENP